MVAKEDREVSIDKIKFADLPINANDPPHSCWIWGADDELGRLNLLRADVVKQAAKEEVITGERLCLKSAINTYPSFATDL